MNEALPAVVDVSMAIGACWKSTWPSVSPGVPHAAPGRPHVRRRTEISRPKYEEAVKYAEEALAGYLETLAKHGDPIPSEATMLRSACRNGKSSNRGPVMPSCQPRGCPLPGEGIDPESRNYDSPNHNLGSCHRFGCQRESLAIAASRGSLRELRYDRCPCALRGLDLPGGLQGPYAGDGLELELCHVAMQDDKPLLPASSGR